MTNPAVVLITGVSSGIGRAVAELLAAQGCTVIGTVRQPATAQALRGVELISMDIRDERSVQEGVRQVIARHGRIDVLINNAGVVLAGAVEETTPEEAQALFDTNVFGILRTARAVLPHMRERRAGRIVNVSSVVGFLPAPYMGWYAASKHAVEGLSETLDHEVRQFGIRVVLVEPSFTQTHLGNNATPTAQQIGDYAAERGKAVTAIQANIRDGTDVGTVAKVLAAAATGPYRMRQPAGGEATMLSILRRFMPAAPVDTNLRKKFGLGS